jgi:hypothetical protein
MSAGRMKETAWSCNVNEGHEVHREILVWQDPCCHQRYRVRRSVVDGPPSVMGRPITIHETYSESLVRCIYYDWAISGRGVIGSIMSYNAIHDTAKVHNYGWYACGVRPDYDLADMNVNDQCPRSEADSSKAKKDIAVAWLELRLYFNGLKPLRSRGPRISLSGSLS